MLLIVDNNKNTIYMAFNTEKYLQTKFEKPTYDFPVPFLKDYFDEGDEPVFKLRGLSLSEIMKCKQAYAVEQNQNAMIEAFSNSNAKHIFEKLKEIMIDNNNSAESSMMRMTMEIGIVEPEMESIHIMSLCENHPIEAYQIFEKIQELTGKGAEAVKKKRKPSGTNQK